MIIFPLQHAALFLTLVSSMMLNVLPHINEFYTGEKKNNKTNTRSVIYI